MKFSLKWGKVHVCRSINTGNTEQNVFLSKHNFCDFVTFFTKKSSNQNWLILPKWRTQKFVIIGDSIAIFYKLNHKEGKKYTYDHFKNCGLSRAGIYKILARFDKFDMVPILKMFDHLKGKIMKADQHGLRSLTKK